MKKNNLITIASGKGGVGKTFISITLAHAYALQGKKILLIDADIGLANIDIQLGIVPQKDLGHVLCEQIDLKTSIIQCKSTGFDLIAGRSGSGFFGGIPSTFLNRIIKDLLLISQDYDHVIIDLEAGIGPIVKEFLKISFINIILLNEEPTSLTDAYALIKVARILNPYIITTNISTENQGKNVFDALSKATHKFMGVAPTYLGGVPKDQNVPHTIRRQTPILNLAPDSLASMALVKLCQEMNKLYTYNQHQTIKQGV
jgi:flagellar biosynthesis protein FlhG